MGSEMCIRDRPIVGANNQVIEGIETVRVALQLDNGDPKVVIDKDRCPNLIRELQTYVWEKSKGGKFVRNAAPRPLKRDDHSCDALRYLLHTNSHAAAKGSVKGGRIKPKNLHRFVN